MPSTSYYARNRERILENRKERYRNNEEHRLRCQERQRAYRLERPEALLLVDARRRAKADNLPFDITIDDIVIPETCPVLGTPIVLGNDYQSRESSPSIDKIIPKLGYVKGNICIISFRANRIKTDASLEELEAVTNYVRKHTNNYG